MAATVPCFNCLLLLALLCGLFHSGFATIPSSTTTALAHATTTTTGVPAPAASTSSTVKPTTGATSATTPSTTALTTASPSPTPPIRQIVISEVSLTGDQDTGFTVDFVELWDVSGKHDIDPSGLTVLIWPANQTEQNVSRIDLAPGNKTGENGFYVVEDFEDILIQKDIIYGVAVYDNLISPLPVSVDDVVDAVTFTFSTSTQTLLWDLSPVKLNLTAASSCVTRCYSSAPKEPGAFTAGSATSMGAPNTCDPPQELRVNEFKLFSTETAMFIEIFSGRRDFPLSQILVVVFDSQTNQTLGSVELQGRTNDTTGIHLLGEGRANQTLQEDILSSLNGVLSGAIALYWRPLWNASQSVNMITDNLLDIVVYGNPGNNASEEFLQVFGKTQVNVPQEEALQNLSLSYCQTDYELGTPTPGAPNQCPEPSTTIPVGPTSTTTQTPISSTNSTTHPPLTPTTPTTASPTPTTPSTSITPSPTTPQPTTTPLPIVIMDINEVYLGQTAADDYVEVKAAGNDIQLKDFVLVALTGSPITMKLTKFDRTPTSDSGIYVSDGKKQLIGGSHLQLYRDCTASCAVALYMVTQERVDLGNTNFTQFSANATLVDFVVYSNERKDEPSDLMKTLAGASTSQTAIVTKPGGQSSITRCAQAVKQMRAFWLMPQTRGVKNNCKPPKIVINEVSLEGSRFVELYDLGVGHTSLIPFFMVAIKGSPVTPQLPSVDLWNEQTNDKGYFLLGVSGGTSNPTPSKTVDKDLPFWGTDSNAVALYKNSLTIFNITTLPPNAELVDVIIFGDRDAVKGLVDKITPEQGFIDTSQTGQLKSPWSISRCFYCGFTKTSLAWSVSAPSPGDPNSCPDNYTASLPDLTPVLINEINSNQPRSTNQEFVELKGPKSGDLRGFVLVFFNGTNGKLYKSTSLEDYTLDGNGFFLLGANLKMMKNVKPPEVIFDKQTLIDTGLGAVALYDGRTWGCAAPSEMTPSKTHLVDALVYSSSTVNTTSPVTKAFLTELTNDGKVFLEDRTVFKQDESISRCGNKQPLSSSEFAIALPTPRVDNSCPSEKFTRSISFKLVEADCKVFMKSEGLLAEVVSVVVIGVNSKCRCGFTEANLKNATFSCGSVILMAEVHAISAEQSDTIFKYYKDFVQSTKTVTVGNKSYTVDSKCLDYCRPVSPPAGSDPHVTIAVVVTCVAVFLIIVLCVILYMKRKRRGIAHFRMARFDAEDENLTVGDADDFVGGGEQASFSNPLYFRT